MAADGQKMAAVAGDDQIGARSDGGGQHMIVVGIARHNARHGGRCGQRHQRRVMRHEFVDAGGKLGDARRQGA